MSDHNKKPNQRSDGGQDNVFSLEEILAEYSSRQQSVPEADAPGKVVPFPQPPVEDKQEDTSEAESTDLDEIAPDAQDSSADEPLSEGKLVAFPEPRPKTLSSLVRKLTRKGNQYAEGMFAEEDLSSDPEIQRRERLIPGVDREERPKRERRARREDPPEPDTSPQELARLYGKGLKGLQVRTTLVFFLLLPALFLVLELHLPLTLTDKLPLLPQHWTWVSAALLGVGMLLGMDLFMGAMRRILRGRLGMDTILLLACIATLGDALTAPYLLPRNELPFCALDLLALYFAMRGELHRRRGLRLACRAAAASAEPYLVTLDQGKWNARDTYAKHSGSPDGFGSQIRADDGAQRIFRIFCPILLLACALLSILVCAASGQPARILWVLSATLTASCTLMAPLIFGRPFHRLSRRLIRSGGALAGWPGAATARRGVGIILTDLDLFPPGSVTLNGIKVYGDWATERVVGYTATLIRASGCGLEKLFHNLLRSQGAIYRQLDGPPDFHEAGGLSAFIRGDQVMVGSASFMALMDVDLPQGLNVKNAIFCAINGELAGIFALSYSLPDVVFPSIDALMRERISPVLATRDFNLIPAVLRSRFKLAADRMDFPPVERRRELSDPEQSHNSTLTAILCREGIMPLSESVVGARRLRTAVRLNAALCCIASTIGLIVSAYLTAMGAFASISSFNLLLYLLLWMIPGWFITSWVDQF